MRSSANAEPRKESGSKKNRDAVERVLRSNDSSDDDQYRHISKSNVPAMTPAAKAEHFQKPTTENILRRRQVMFDSDEDEPGDASAAKNVAQSEKTTSRTSMNDAAPNAKPARTPKMTKLAKLLGDDPEETEVWTSSAAKSLPASIQKRSSEASKIQRGKLGKIDDAGTDGTAKSSKLTDRRATTESQSAKRAPSPVSFSEIVELVQSERLFEGAREDFMNNDDMGSVSIGKAHDRISAKDAASNKDGNEIDVISKLDSKTSEATRMPKDDVDQWSSPDNRMQRPNHARQLVVGGVGKKIRQPKPDVNRSAMRDDSDSSLSERPMTPNRNMRQSTEANIAKPKEKGKFDPKIGNLKREAESRQKIVEPNRAKQCESPKLPITPLPAESNTHKPPSGKYARNDATIQAHAAKLAKSVAITSRSPKVANRELYSKQRSDQRGKTTQYKTDQQSLSDSDSDDLDEIAGRRARAVMQSSSSPASIGASAGRVSRALKSEDNEACISEEVMALTEQIAILHNEISTLRRQLSEQSEISERQNQLLEKNSAKARDDEAHFKSVIADLENQLRSSGTGKNSRPSVLFDGKPPIDNHVEANNSELAADMIIGRGERIKPSIGKVWEDERKRNEVEAPYRRLNLMDSKPQPDAIQHPIKIPPQEPPILTPEQNIYSQEPQAASNQESIIPSTPEVPENDHGDNGAPKSILKAVDEPSAHSSLSTKNEESLILSRPGKRLGQDERQSERPAALSTQDSAPHIETIDRNELQLQLEREQQMKDVAELVKSNLSMRGEGVIVPTTQSKDLKSSTADVEISFGPGPITSPSAQSGAVEPPPMWQSPQVTSADTLSNRPVSMSSDLSDSVTSQSSSFTKASNTIKTPNRKGIVRTVSVVRQPVLGAQINAQDKIGIGISFGVTAKGDVFITGMADKGPAQLCGQIRRGDQLLSVNGVSIRGWDVNEIVKSIIGPNGSTVTLEIASFPELKSPEPSPAK